MTRKILLAVAAVTSLVVGVDSALAYIVPAEELLERAEKVRKRLRVRALLLRGTHEQDGVRSQVWEVIRPGAQRRELRRGDQTSVVLTRGRRQYAFSPGTGPVRPTKGPIETEVMTKIAFPDSEEKNPQSGTAMLRALGIDTSVVSFNRQDRRIVFVIGAKANEPNKPQLWLDKELLVPVRLLTFKKGVPTDRRWLGAAAPLTRPYFPRRIETWVDGKLVESLTYSEIDVNPRLDDVLFEPPK